MVVVGVPFLFVAALTAAASLAQTIETTTSKTGTPTTNATSVKGSPEAAPVVQVPLPTVTLDYVSVAPSTANTSSGYYVFKNVRYAAIPTGTRRFAAPTWPAKIIKVKDGTNVAANVDCRSSEDCLYCDVYTPVKAFDGTGKKFPVVQWYWGGGYSYGSKTSNDPAGLFNVTRNFVFVSCNHRLGYTGLADSPSYQEQGGVSNLGTRDVEHAFKWTRKYIGAFGGDSTQVTAAALSSGSGQVLWQLTRYGGRNAQLFDRAFLLSPGLNPGAGNEVAETMWQNTAAALNCTGGDLTCMRSVNFTSLINTAYDVSGQTGYQLQPRLDSDFLTSSNPGSAFAQRHYTFSGPLVLSHLAHETNSRAWGGVDTDDDVGRFVRSYFPAMTDAALRTVLDLYPAADYASPGLRFSDIYQDFHYTAPLPALTRANGNASWNVLLDIAGTGHAYDQAYYFYNGGDGGVNATIARQMQAYFLSFVLTGDPNKWRPGTRTQWPQFTSAQNLLVVNDTAATTFQVRQGDDLDNAKSAFWNKGVWF